MRNSKKHWLTVLLALLLRYPEQAADRERSLRVDAFIDPDGHCAFLDAEEAEHRQGVVH